MKRSMPSLAVVITAAALLTAGGCSYTPPSSYTTSPTTPPPPNTVVMANMAFTPVTITVDSGTTVTWRNADGYAPHTATSDSSTWDTGSIGTGASKAITFSVRGTYPYHCQFHGSMGMTGTVVVR